MLRNLLIAAIFKAIFIPVQFEDTALTCSIEQLNAYVGTAQEYFNAQFKGITEFQFGISPVVSLGNTLAFYGANGETEHDYNIRSAVEAACRAADPYVDFAEYDNDSKGCVDCVVLFCAGLSEADGAGDDYIWPQQGHMKDRGPIPLVLDEKIIDAYLIVCELKSDMGENARQSGIGDFCHEFGHILGLPDLYDTDMEAGGGLAKGVWNTSLMSEGSRNDDGRCPPNMNAVEREILGTGNVMILEPGSFILPPISQNGDYIRAESGTMGEYYLFECRSAEGWDKAIGGSGLLIYHIDKREPDYSILWDNNKVNNNPKHECADLIEANPEAASTREIFFPQAGNSSFSSDSPTPFLFWNGSKSELALTGIHIDSEKNIRFNVIRPITMMTSDIFQDAVILGWSVDETLKNRCRYRVSWKERESQDSEESVETGTTPCCTIERLKPGTSYVFTVKAVTDTGETFSVSSTFTTKVLMDGTHPYINLNTSDRNPDGSFKPGAKIFLRVINARDAEEIRWYFNSIEIHADEYGKFMIRGNGTLKSVLTYADGSSDIIMKELVVE